MQGVQGIEVTRRKFCTVHSCKHYNEQSMIKMFAFPKDVVQNKIWRNALQIPGNNYCHGLVCMKHFDQKDIRGGKTPKLRKGAIPSIVSDDRIPSIPSVVNVNERGKNELRDFVDVIDAINPISNQKRSKRSESIELEQLELVKFDSCESCETRESYETELFDPFGSSFDTNSKDSKDNDILKLEINNLKRKHLQMQADYIGQIEKIQEQLDKTTSELNLLKNQAGRLKRKYAYERSTNKRLRSTLMTLRKKNLLDKESIDFIKVNTYVLYVLKVFNFF